MRGERDSRVTLTAAAAAPRPGSAVAPDPRPFLTFACAVTHLRAEKKGAFVGSPRGPWPAVSWAALPPGGRERGGGRGRRPWGRAPDPTPGAGPRPGARVRPGKAGRALTISPRPGSWPGGKPPQGREWFLPTLGTVSSGTPDAGSLEAWPRLGEGHGTLPPAPAPPETGNAFSAQSLGSVPLPLAAQPRDCRILKIDANSYPSPFVSCLFLSFVRFPIFNFFLPLDDF